MNDQPTSSQRDPELWKMAKRRAAFKYHVGVYLVINGFLWVLWLFTHEHSPGNKWPWPIWTTMSWGVALLFHYLSVYMNPRGNATQREYERLKQNQNRQL